MSSSDDGDGRAGRMNAGRYLERRSAIVKEAQALGRVVRVLVVDDSDFDARRLEASLRVLLGSHLETRHARTADEMMRAVGRGFDPDAIVLDDRLSGGVEAEASVERLRASGCLAPIVIVSGFFGLARRQALARLGVAGVFDKDDVDALSLMELFLPKAPK